MAGNSNEYQQDDELSNKYQIHNINNNDRQMQEKTKGDYEDNNKKQW